MRRVDKLVTDQELLKEVLSRAPFGHLAMSDEGTPYVLPLSFGYDGTHLYFHSATKGRKVDVLKNNPNVCVQFTEDIKLVMQNQPCDWGFGYLSVLCMGKVVLLTDPHDKAQGLNQIISQYKDEYYSYGFSQDQLSCVNVYKVLLDEIVGKQSTT